MVEHISIHNKQEIENQNIGQKRYTSERKVIKMTEYENGYSMELKEKLICRFCLTQDDPLTNIYSTKNQQHSQASLSLQIMACVSIEVCSFKRKNENYHYRSKNDRMNNIV